jgi:hypothetical protein
MLRSLLIAIGVVCFLGGLFALVTGLSPPSYVLLFWGALLLIGTIFERVRYKPIETSAPGPGWTETPERFIDRETGEAVTVWLDPASGERKYVRG